MLAYPRRRGSIVALAAAILLMLLSVPLAVSRFVSGAIGGGVGFAVLALGCAYGSVLLIAQLARPRPVASLDEAGFACAAGSVSWNDVSGVTTSLVYTIYRGNRRYLVVTSAPGAELRPPERRFLDNWLFGRAELRGSSLVLPVWGPKEQVLAAIRRFYDGPIED